MKKFILPISIIIVMIIGLVVLTGCENGNGNNESNENDNNTKAVITNNIGDTETLNSEELYEISKSNEAKFKK